MISSSPVSARPLPAAAKSAAAGGAVQPKRPVAAPPAPVTVAPSGMQAFENQCQVALARAEELLKGVYRQTLGRVLSADDKPTAKATAKPASPQFASALHQSFMKDGKPLRFVGTNCYDLMGMSDAAIDTAFKHMHDATGVKVVRFWAFQAYTKGGTDFSKMDRILAAAKRNDITVIPVLEDQWETMTQGGYKSADWFKGGYKQPDGNYKMSFQQFAETIVDRYKNDPAIFSWMLLNESESMDPDALYGFAKDMTADIKQHDANHMVTLGVLGGPQPGMLYGNYSRIMNLPTVDWAEYHDYAADDQAMPSYVASRLSDAKKLDKPLLIAEAGMSVSPDKGWQLETPASRAQKLGDKMDALFKAGGAGYMVWDYRPGSDKGVDYDDGDPLEAVLKQRADELASKQL